MRRQAEMEPQALRSAPALCIPPFDPESTFPHHSRKASIP